LAAEAIDEADLLERALLEKRSELIFPGEATGPDLIVLFWNAQEQPMVVLVQSKSN